MNFGKASGWLVGALVIAAAGCAHEEGLADFIRRKQDAASQFAGYFAPSSRLQLFVRNQVTKLLALPPVARLSFGRDLADRVDLPEY